MKFLIVLAAVVALAVAQQTDSNSINPPNCGERPLKTRNKIVGGQEAVPGDWGWQIVLLNYGGFRFVNQAILFISKNLLLLILNISAAVVL